MTSAMAPNSANKQQIVWIISVDPTTHTAVGRTRQGQTLTINTQYLVGAIHYTPGVGEQWYIKQVGTVQWALDRKLPKNTNDLLNVADNPVPGQVQIGSSGIVSGPLNLMGSGINAMAPLGLMSYSTANRPDAVAAGPGALIYDSTLEEIVISDGTQWSALTGGGGGGGPVHWADIEDIPTTFPSDWADISDIPSNFPTIWTDVSGKPTTYPADWAGITNKPATFPPTLPTGTGGPGYFWSWSGDWEQPPTGAGATQLRTVVPTGPINNTNLVFTLPAFTTGTTRIYVNGIRQTLGTDYEETNDTTITLVTAPQSTGVSDSLSADYVPAGGPDALVPNEVPTGAVNGINNTFTTANEFATGTTSAFINGLREQINVDYVESRGNEIIFTTPPPSGDKVELDYLLPSYT